MTSDERIRNPVEALAEEFMRRRRDGEDPTIDEYEQRHPDFAGEIRELFPALEIMEHVRDDVVDRAAVSRHSVSSFVGVQLGDFQVLREIGRGGMGTVYEAQQTSLGRRVALKILADQLVRSPKSLERFRREAKIAAGLQHTNIVPVFGFGSDESVHFYVMQYIHGRGMDEVLDALQGKASLGVAKRYSANSLATALTTGNYRAMDLSRPAESGSGEIDKTEAGGPDGSNLTAALIETAAQNGGSTVRPQTDLNYYQRIAHLGSQVADALALAHSRGVLHRDIKPSNLLFDVFGDIWVTDFGLAKIEGEDDLTSTGDVLGTLRYLAPESFRGQFDARSDIYSLGLTLYELIGRQKAFDGSDRGALVQQISQEGPVRLSRRASDVPKDLEIVVHKAIQIERSDRYASANELAEDLRRVARNEPVLARQVSALERLSRWSRRNRALSVLITSVALLLVSGIVGSVAVSARLSQLAAARKEESDDAKRRLVEANIYRAEGLAGSRRPGQRLDGLKAIAESVPLAVQLGMGDEVVRRLRNAAIACMAHADIVTTKEWKVDAATTFHTDIDGARKHYAIRGRSGEPVRICRIEDHHEVNAIKVNNPLASIRLSYDGRFLAGVTDRSLGVWDIATGESVCRYDLVHKSKCFAFGRTRNRLALATTDGFVRVLELPSMQLLCELPPAGRVSCLAFDSTDERMVVCRAPDRSLKNKGGIAQIFQLDDVSAPVDIPLTREANSVAMAPQDFLAISDDSNVHVFDVRLKQRIGTIAGKQTDLEFDPTGRFLVAGVSNLTTIWDARTSRHVLSFDGHLIGFKGDMLAYSTSGRLKLARIVSGDECNVLLSGPSPYMFTCHPDNRILVKPGTNLEVWDLEERRKLATTQGWHFWSAQFSPDGRNLYTVASHGHSAERRLFRWPYQKVDAGSNAWQLGPPELIKLPDNLQPHKLAMDAAGRVLATDASRSQKVIAIYPRGDRTPLVMDAPPMCMFVAVSPNGRWLATGTWHGKDVAVFDLQTGRLVRQIPVGQTHVTFSPDSKYLLYGVGVRTELETWKESQIPYEYDLPFESPLFVANGRIGVFAKRTYDATLMLFDTATWRPFGRLTSSSDTERVSCRGVTPDGVKFVIDVIDVRHSQRVEVWDLREVRRQLAEIDLDWDLPSLNEPEETRHSIHVTVDVGELK